MPRKEAVVGEGTSLQNRSEAKRAPDTVPQLLGPVKENRYRTFRPLDKRSLVGAFCGHKRVKQLLPG
jgi:hypothetical protein